MCTLTTGKDIPYYIYARAKEKDDGVNGINGKDGETTGWGLREGELSWKEGKGFLPGREKCFCKLRRMFFLVKKKKKEEDTGYQIVQTTITHIRKITNNVNSYEKEKFIFPFFLFFLYFCTSFA